MFLSHASVRKRFLVKSVLPFLASCLVMGSAVLSGCKEDKDTGNIIGSWISIFKETWTITVDTVIADNYAGEIVNNPNFEASAGVIIIKYTTKPKYYDYGPAPDYKKTGPFDPPGDYYAIYWKSLTATSIELANAWDISDFNHTGAPETKTLSEAQTKFTLNNAASYVGSYSSCEKH